MSESRPQLCHHPMDVALGELLNSRPPLPVTGVTRACPQAASRKPPPWKDRGPFMTHSRCSPPTRVFTGRRASGGRWGFAGVTPPRGRQPRAAGWAASSWGRPAGVREGGEADLAPEPREGTGAAAHALCEERPRPAPQMSRPRPHPSPAPSDKGPALDPAPAPGPQKLPGCRQTTSALVYCHEQLSCALTFTPQFSFGKINRDKRTSGRAL